MNVEYWNVMRRVMIVILIVGIKVGVFFFNEKFFV